MKGFPKSSSFTPAARNKARCGAFSYPFLIISERIVLIFLWPKIFYIERLRSRLSFKTMANRYKKSRLGFGGSRSFRVMELFSSHLRHPNQKQVLNNKDRKNDYKYEAEQIIIHSFSNNSQYYMLYQK